MIWFEGVVEDRHDPEGLFRVRVRVFGLYSENRALIPTDHLHWSQVMHPTTSAAVNGIGQTPSFVEGTHVIGFFRDGDNYQDPVILGTIAGFSTELPKNTGFYDPNLVYPKKEYIGEQDTSRHARNNKISETITQKKIDSRVTGMKVPDGDISQPEVPYNAKYPYNKVTETESGHVIEYDDTPGSERICLTHRTGSFIEIHPDGAVTIKSVSDRFEVSSGDKTKIVGGSDKVHVSSDAKLYVGGNYNIEVAGNVTWNIAGDSIYNVSGVYDVNASIITLN